MLYRDMANRELGIMEKAQALTNEVFPFNAVVVLRVANGPSEETLRKVLNILQRRFPLLRVHIRKEKKRYFFESQGTPAIPLKVVNREKGTDWQQVVEEELNRTIDFLKGPLVRLTYITGPARESESEIVITFHHAIIDADSGTNLAHEMLTLCTSLASAGEFRTLEPIPPVENFFPPAYKGIRRMGNIFRFLLRQVGDEFLYRLRSRGSRKAPIHTAGRCKILPVKLSKETTGALCKGARRKRITLNSLMEAAILMAVHKHIYQGKGVPLRSFSMADLRPYLVPPLSEKHLGSYFAMMRFSVRMKENPRVWDLAGEINDLMYASVKRGDKFAFNLLSAQMMKALLKFKAFRMATTAVSYTGPVKLEKVYGKTAVKDIHVFISNFVLGPEYTAAVRLFNRQFYWDILYLDSDMGFEEAKVLADEIVNLMEAAVKEED